MTLFLHQPAFSADGFSSVNLVVLPKPIYMPE